MAAAFEELLLNLKSSDPDGLSDTTGVDRVSEVANPTRRRIAEAALAVFAERSYEGATTRAIASRAGVTERTLFKHFPTKDELFARTVFPALLTLLRPLTIGGLQQVLSAHQGDFRATLREIVAERIHFATGHADLISILVRELISRPAFRAAVQQFFETQMWPSLRAMLDQARDTGQMRQLPSPVALRCIAGQVLAYLVPRIFLEYGGPSDDALEVDRIVDLILKGLSGGASEAG